MSLKVQGLSKRYKNTLALSQVSCEVESSAAILGPNGAGKSTFLSCLAGLERASAGEILVRGRKLSREVPVSYLATQSMLYANLSVRENLELFATLSKAGSPSKRVNEIVDFLNLGEFSETLVKHCSYGITKRASFARALLSNPEILLLDEPTNGIDKETLGQLELVLGELISKGVLLLVATHDEEFAKKNFSKGLYFQQAKLARVEDY